MNFGPRIADSSATSRRHFLSTTAAATLGMAGRASAANRAHLDGCAACRVRVAEFRTFLAAEAPPGADVRDADARLGGWLDGLTAAAPAAQDAADVFKRRWDLLLYQDADYSENASPFEVDREIAAAGSSSNTTHGCDADKNFCGG